MTDSVDGQSTGDCSTLEHAVSSASDYPKLGESQGDCSTDEQEQEAEVGSRLSKANEVAWLQVATLAAEGNDFPRATDAYKHVLEHNNNNIHSLLQLASIARMQERFMDAIGYLNRILEIDGPSGDVHGAIGHCYLTLSGRHQEIPPQLDCLNRCNHAYSEAARYCSPSSDPNLWYGMGVLYERYGALMPAGPARRESFQAAERALNSVAQAAPGFEKRTEIMYRYETALETALPAFLTAPSLRK